MQLAGSLLALAVVAMAQDTTFPREFTAPAQLPVEDVGWPLILDESILTISAAGRTERASRRIYRDAQGRIRAEIYDESRNVRAVEIHDVVTGNYYVLDPGRQVAHRVFVGVNPDQLQETKSEPKVYCPHPEAWGGGTPTKIGDEGGVETYSVWEVLPCKVPEPELFRVPENFQIVDETGPFWVGR